MGLFDMGGSAHCPGRHLTGVVKTACVPEQCFYCLVTRLLVGEWALCCKGAGSLYKHLPDKAIFVQNVEYWLP